MSEETEGQGTGAGPSGAGVEPVAATLPTFGDQVSALWRRLKDHRIAQWSIGYIAVAYGIQHAVTLTTEAFEWPHAIVRISMLLLTLGMPIVVAVAWYHGERVNRRISGPELTIISILLVIGSFLFYVFVRPSEQSETESSAKVQEVASAISMPSPRGAVSVAVLPFLNLSGDPKQEFFSDGMTEEITSALAKVKGMAVVARTSAFQFKGENKDIRAVGRALGANRLIEGSVRMAGDRVRITAQLIQSDTGAHLWTESYDRELKDVFAVQEDIAQAIAGALQVPLGLNEGEHLVSNRTNNTSSYQDYLRARALYRARNIWQVIAVLEPMVKRDPTYAPAWALLADAYQLAPFYMFSPHDGSIKQVSARYQSIAKQTEWAAQQALRLDPHNAAAHAALANAALGRLDWTTVFDQFRQALALDPNDPDTLHLYSLSGLLSSGYLKQGLNIRDKLRNLEPLVPAYNIFTAVALLNQGQTHEAVNLLETVPTGGPTDYFRNKYLATALAATGRFGEAADTLLSTPPTAFVSRTAIENAAQYLRNAPKTAVRPNELPDFLDFSFVYPLIDAPNRAFEETEYNISIEGAPSALWEIWNPIFAPLRKTERFKELVRNAKLVDYWRAKGWPDLCHPAGADDFACN